MLLALAAATFGCRVPVARTGLPVSHNLPPAQMLAEPGPGVGGPGPGVMAQMPPAGGYMPGAGPGFGPAGMGSTSVQVILRSPNDDTQSMQVYWDVSGVGQYDSSGAQTPVRQNFTQGGVYRLKVTDIPGREGMTLYPTLEIGPGTPRTAAYLEHAAVPVQFTEEDFDQVTAGNFVTKVIYVPDPEFQELALAGVDTLVSTRLDPGVDPIVEADRRGAILAVLRMGNKNMEMPGMEAGAAGGGMAGGVPIGGTPATSSYISGVTGPAYGMPYTGTNIGLPGPPHVPLGGPAGLKRYTMHNHTATHIPGPTHNVDVHMQQRPGLSYPRPANKVIIREETRRNPHYNAQPPADMLHMPACGNPGCTGCGVCGG